MRRPDLSKDPEQVGAMFDRVARGYDRANTILSGGCDHLWRVATRNALAPRWGERVLDVAAGTGTSSVALAAVGAEVTAADFSSGMVAVGRERYKNIDGIEFVLADATNLPFADGSFDAVTISFGLRNVVDPKQALREFFRVVRPGGRLVICEFSLPRGQAVRASYLFYLRRVMPVVARVVTSDPGAYDYLSESIAAWPRPRALSGWIAEAGFTSVQHRLLTGGIVALHRATKPGEASGAGETQ